MANIEADIEMYKKSIAAWKAEREALNSDPDRMVRIAELQAKMDALRPQVEAAQKKVANIRVAIRESLGLVAVKGIFQEVATPKAIALLEHETGLTWNEAALVVRRPDTMKFFEGHPFDVLARNEEFRLLDSDPDYIFATKELRDLAAQVNLVECGASNESPGLRVLRNQTYRMARDILGEELALANLESRKQARDEAAVSQKNPSAQDEARRERELQKRLKAGRVVIGELLTGKRTLDLGGAQ